MDALGIGQFYVGITARVVEQVLVVSGPLNRRSVESVPGLPLASEVGEAADELREPGRFAVGTWPRHEVYQHCGRDYAYDCIKSRLDVKQVSFNVSGHAGESKALRLRTPPMDRCGHGRLWHDSPTRRFDGVRG